MGDGKNSLFDLQSLFDNDDEERKVKEFDPVKLKLDVGPDVGATAFESIASGDFQTANDLLDTERNIKTEKYYELMKKAQGEKGYLSPEQALAFSALSLAPAIFGYVAGGDPAVNSVTGEMAGGRNATALAGLKTGLALKNNYETDMEEEADREQRTYAAEMQAAAQELKQLNELREKAAFESGKERAADERAADRENRLRAVLDEQRRKNDITQQDSLDLRSNPVIASGLSKLQRAAAGAGLEPLTAEEEMAINSNAKAAAIAARLIQPITTRDTAQDRNSIAQDRNSIARLNADTAARRTDIYDDNVYADNIRADDALAFNKYLQGEKLKDADAAREQQNEQFTRKQNFTEANETRRTEGYLSGITSANAARVLAGEQRGRALDLAQAKHLEDARQFNEAYKFKERQAALNNEYRQNILNLNRDEITLKREAAEFSRQKYADFIDYRDRRFEFDQTRYDTDLEYRKAQDAIKQGNTEAALALRKQEIEQSERNMAANIYARYQELGLSKEKFAEDMRRYKEGKMPIEFSAIHLANIAERIGKPLEQVAQEINGMNPQQHSILNSYVYRMGANAKPLTDTAVTRLADSQNLLTSLQKMRQYSNKMGNMTAFGRFIDNATSIDGPAAQYYAEREMVKKIYARLNDSGALSAIDVEMFAPLVGQKSFSILMDDKKARDTILDKLIAGAMQKTALIADVYKASGRTMSPELQGVLNPNTQSRGGLSPEKQRRLEELRQKKATGTLQQ